MPKVKGLKVEDAIRELEAVGLKANPVPGNPARSKDKEGYVEKQNPSANTPLEKDKTVTLTAFTRYAAPRDEPKRRRLAESCELQYEDIENMMREERIDHRVLNRLNRKMQATLDMGCGGHRMQTVLRPATCDLHYRMIDQAPEQWLARHVAKVAVEQIGCDRGLMESALRTWRPPPPLEPSPPIDRPPRLPPMGEPPECNDYYRMIADAVRRGDKLSAHMAAAWAIGRGCSRVQQAMGGFGGAIPEGPGPSSSSEPPFIMVPHDEAAPGCPPGQPGCPGPVGQ